MNTPEHAAAGALAGVVAISIVNKHTGVETELPDVLIGALFGGIAGLLPDILEPATNPHHRALCHSVLALLLTLYATWKIHSSTELTTDQKKALAALTYGITSHLWTDGLTPIGLPLLC